MTQDVLPWERARHLPWHVFTSPAEKWATQPSFVLGEYLFLGLAAAALVHALRQGDERRRHVLVWALALLAGTANDMIFMALPLVDNFWQAQATIMITPRLPLYIPCVYICFMYFPTVSAWRLHLPALPRAALSGLAASAFYAPYDIVGAKFLWWTWHDTDPPIARRLLGAPVGSTMWTITFVAAFSFLIGRAVDRDPRVTGRTIAKAVAMVCGLSTLLMMVQMTALQQLDGGTPGPRGLVVLVALFGGLAALGVRKAAAAARAPAGGEVPVSGGGEAPVAGGGEGRESGAGQAPVSGESAGAPLPGVRPADRLLLGAVVVYFAALIVFGAVFEPATHRSASLHQTIGPCRVGETDITGATRHKYLCAEDFDEDFSLACLERPPESGSAWYTVCGLAHRGFPAWMAGVAGLGVTGALLYSFLLGALRGRRRG